MLLHPITRITLPDNTTKQISKLRIGDEVLGIDNNNVIRPTKITHIRKENPTLNWINFSGRLINRGRGGSYYSLKISQKDTTDNLSFSSPQEKMSIESIVTKKNFQKSKIAAIHSNITPTKTQESIIIGMMLGDGTYSPKTQTCRFTHSDKQKDYHDWLIAALGPIVNQTYQGKSGYGSTLHTTALTRIHGMDWTGWNKAKGVIPENISHKLNPISMAIWYMDDGSIQQENNSAPKIYLSTYSFNEKSHNILQQGLLKFGIESMIQKSAKGNSIRINTESADLFFALIAAYVPPSMQYKLPEYYRGNKGWIPVSRDSGYRTTIDYVDIDNVDEHYGLDRQIKYSGHTIRTETDNFFASRLLISTNS